jgi:hypothetical protein
MRSPTIEHHERENPVEGESEDAQQQNETNHYSGGGHNPLAGFALSNRHVYSIGNKTRGREGFQHPGFFRLMVDRGRLAKLGPVRPSGRQAGTTSDDALGNGEI